MNKQLKDAIALFEELVPGIKITDIEIGSSFIIFNGPNLISYVNEGNSIKIVKKKTGHQITPGFTGAHNITTDSEI